MQDAGQGANLRLIDVWEHPIMKIILNESGNNQIWTVSLKQDLQRSTLIIMACCF